MSSCYVYCHDPEIGEYKTFYYDDPKVFGEKLKQLRKSKGLTIKQFSSAIGWWYWCVEDWEKGEMVSIVTLRKIAQFFGVTVEYLLSDKHNEQLSLF